MRLESVDLQQLELNLSTMFQVLTMHMVLFSRSIHFEAELGYVYLTLLYFWSVCKL